MSRPAESAASGVLDATRRSWPPCWPRLRRRPVLLFLRGRDLSGTPMAEGGRDPAFAGRAGRVSMGRPTTALAQPSGSRPTTAAPDHRRVRLMPSTRPTRRVATAAHRVGRAGHARAARVNFCPSRISTCRRFGVDRAARARGSERRCCAPFWSDATATGRGLSETASRATSCSTRPASKVVTVVLPGTDGMAGSWHAARERGSPIALSRSRRPATSRGRLARRRRTLAVDGDDAMHSCSV